MTLIEFSCFLSSSSIVTDFGHLSASVCSHFCQGTPSCSSCLLSYVFSFHLPPSQKPLFLTNGKTISMFSCPEAVGWVSLLFEGERHLLSVMATQNAEARAGSFQMGPLYCPEMQERDLNAM